MAYDGMTVAELKELLRERGLPVSGKKADLISRLGESDSSPAEAEEEAPEAEEEAPEAEEEGDEEFYEEEGDYDDWEDDFHTARQKPVLDESTKAALEMRAAQSKKQPAFRRQEWFRYRRLSKTGYRKPKGKDSKMRMNRKYRSPMARVGYGKVASARGLHPSGFEEVLVHNIDELDGIDPERQAIRIGSSVGNRKRSRIHDRADDLGLRVLNRRSIERKGDIS
ncbi:MAG: 50S ribosomal protein L32e [Candidatus Thermoplasmatota archaeon]|nr:50S ribosomal protein L32e [Candidatus Thermoplasmatota archaeon]